MPAYSGKRRFYFSQMEREAWRMSVEGAADEVKQTVSCGWCAGD
jgi:hypothetical protein